MNITRATLPIAVIVLIVSACASGSAGASPTPSGTPAGSPAPTTDPSVDPSAAPIGGPVTTEAEAVARIVAAEPRFDGIMPFRDDLIGQANWYKVSRSLANGDFQVTVRLGWGDCPAGCIEEHIWEFTVARDDGTVSVVSETGDQVPITSWPATAIDADGGRSAISGLATAGPICPVEKNPPDPSCAPRPVVGATVVIRNASGAVIAQLATDPAGAFFADLEPGRYIVEALPADGLLGTPGPQPVTVEAGVTSTVQLDYDTGIR